MSTVPSRSSQDISVPGSVGQPEHFLRSSPERPFMTSNRRRDTTSDRSRLQHDTQIQAAGMSQGTVTANGGLPYENRQSTLVPTPTPSENKKRTDLSLTMKSRKKSLSMELGALNLPKSQVAESRGEVQSPRKGKAIVLTEENHRVELTAGSIAGNVVVQHKPAIDSVEPTPSLDRASSVTDLEPFRNPIALPNSTRKIIFIYPHSGSIIEKRHIERFDVVVNLLRQNVESVPDLRSYSSEIDYTLKMCGESPETSHPSIIVFCRNCYFHKLKSVLTSRHILCQYYPLDPSLLKKIVDWCKSASQPAEDALYLPRFKIYFWCDVRIPRVLYWGKLEDIVVEQPRTSRQIGNHLSPTWCGSKVVSMSKLATLACLLEVNSHLYGLTVQHVFAEANGVTASGTKDPEKVQSQNLGSVASIPAWVAILDKDDFAIEDVEYEIAVNDKVDTVHKSYKLDSYGMSSFSQRVRELYDGAKTLDIIHTALIYPTTELKHEQEADLDWALVEVREEDERPNLFPEIKSHDNSLKGFSRVAPHHPGEEREVIIISSSLRYLRGTLLCGHSYLGGITRTGSASVWSIVLSGKEKLSKGDSGSLVLDTQSHEAYGYVVASSPLADIYVIPLKATIEQIKLAFNTDKVSLPDPEMALAASPPLSTPTKTSVMSFDLAEDIVPIPEPNQIDPWSFESGITGTNDPWTARNRDPWNNYTAFAGDELGQRSISAAIHGSDTSTLGYWNDQTDVLGSNRHGYSLLESPSGDPLETVSRSGHGQSFVRKIRRDTPRARGSSRTQWPDD